MIVHGAIISPNVRKVLAVLGIKGLEYDQTQVLPGTKTPEFLEISPLGMIPAFEDGDFCISDSSIIIEYLEEQYPEIPVMPSGAKDRAKSRWIEEYGGSVLFPCCAAVFRERVVKPNYFKQPTDTARVEQALNEGFPPALDHLESKLPDEGFCFDDIGVADISIASPIINAEYGGYSVDGSRWPLLAGLIGRVKEHPTFRKLLTAEREMLLTIQNGTASSS